MARKRRAQQHAVQQSWSSQKVRGGTSINRVLATLVRAQGELALCDVMGGGLPVLPLYVDYV